MFFTKEMWERIEQAQAEFEENRQSEKVVWERLAPKYKYEIQNFHEGEWETFGAPGRHPLILNQEDAINMAETKADRYPGISFRVVEVEL